MLYFFLVALNYGVFRRDSFNSSATYMMFFDMGSTSTTVSIVGKGKIRLKNIIIMLRSLLNHCSTAFSPLYRVQEGSGEGRWDGSY